MNNLKIFILWDVSRWLMRIPFGLNESAYSSFEPQWLGKLRPTLNIECGFDQEKKKRIKKKNECGFQRIYSYFFITTRFYCINGYSQLPSFSSISMAPLLINSILGWT